MEAPEPSIPAANTSHLSPPAGGSLLIPIFVAIALFVLHLIQIAVTAADWPDRIATHFDIHGNPDGWMARQTHLLAWFALSTLLPLFMIGVFFSVRFFPPHLVNIPYRDYWLSPARRATTARTMLAMGLWFASGMWMFLIVLYQLILKANQVQPPQLNNTHFLIALGFFLLGVALWVVQLYRLFRAPGGNA